MSKEKLKQKNHTSHFAPHISNKGITLIALIITIVVMLILVAVTLTIALGENGVVNNAKEAKEKTEIATEKEQLLDAVFATVGKSGEVKLEDIVLPEGFTEVSSGDTKVIYQGPSGKQYEVENKTGKITEVVEIEAEGDGDGEDTNPVAGTYYDAANFASITLNEDGTGTLAGDNITYTYNDTAVTLTYGSESVICNYYELENNKIIILGDEGDELMFAQNRNGLEGEEISGKYRWVDYSSSGDRCLTINSETGKFFAEEREFGSGVFKADGYYYYYNDTIYSDEGIFCSNFTSSEWVKE